VNLGNDTGKKTSRGNLVEKFL